MKLSRNIDKVLIAVMIFILSFVFVVSAKHHSEATFAEGEDTTFVQSEDYFVTFYDDGTKLTVKTDAKTVGEAIKRAGILLDDSDIVEPGLESEINNNNFFINIYRSAPVMIKDGAVEKYLMTANRDPKAIAREAGMTIYDGDEIKSVPNKSFLEAGAMSVYEITRNGGRTLTVEEEIAFSEEIVRDYNLQSGMSEVRQIGEVGMKRVYYNVQYVNNVEVSREVEREEVVREPVARIVAVGAKKSVPPEAATCAEWAKQAGVSETDLSAAIDLIYHESGCRVDARNASGAYGIPQALPGNKMASAGADWETNPVTQIKWMISYVNGRYGGWQQALDFWYSHGWY